MIHNILKAVALTAVIAILAIALIATLYVSLWLILAAAVVGVFIAIFNLLKAKSHLVNNSCKL